MYNEEWRVRSVAVALYWAERNYFAQTGSYTADLVRACHLEIMASVKRYPPYGFECPGYLRLPASHTNGYSEQYPNPPQTGCLLTEIMTWIRFWPMGLTA